MALAAPPFKFAYVVKLAKEEMMGDFLKKGLNGFQLEAEFLNFLQVNGVPVRKATEVEDLHQATDLWVQISGQWFAIQIGEFYFMELEQSETMDWLLKKINKTVSKSRGRAHNLFFDQADLCLQKSRLESFRNALTLLQELPFKKLKPVSMFVDSYHVYAYASDLISTPIGLMETGFYQVYGREAD